eukprot:11783247-Alexandrium_andersonii.AAC.1
MHSFRLGTPVLQVHATVCVRAEPQCSALHEPTRLLTTCAMHPFAYHAMLRARTRRCLKRREPQTKTA